MTQFKDNNNLVPRALFSGFRGATCHSTSKVSEKCPGDEVEITRGLYGIGTGNKWPLFEK